MAGDVGHVVGAGGRGAAEGAGPQVAGLVAVEGDAGVLEPEDLVRRLPAHDLDRVLVAEVVRPLDGVERVGLPVSSGLSAALMPPAAATECERTGWTLEMIATVAPVWAAASAARWPARPAPMIRTSCEGTPVNINERAAGPVAAVRCTPRGPPPRRPRRARRRG